MNLAILAAEVAMAGIVVVAVEVVVMVTAEVAVVDIGVVAVVKADLEAIVNTIMPTDEAMLKRITRSSKGRHILTPYNEHLTRHTHSQLLIYGRAYHHISQLGHEVRY